MSLEITKVNGDSIGGRFQSYKKRKSNNDIGKYAVGYDCNLWYICQLCNVDYLEL